MDSGSGSMQSSSGADEEYDSHQQSQLFPPPPSFFSNANILPPSHIISSTGSSSSSSIPHHLPFHLSGHHNYQSPHPNFYDYPSNYSLQLPPNFNHDSANSFLNLDVVRPTPASTLRSEPTDFKNPPSCEGSTVQNQIPVRSAAPSSAPAGLHPKVTTKKRTRASRRAPTTVLTTDTSNFRAMVQEFTGIPSPPFSAGGSSFSRRFDLFGSVRTTTTAAATNILEGCGSGLYPSPSKVQLPLLNNNNNNNNNVHVVMEGQTVSSNMEQAQGGIFSFQSLSGHGFNSKQPTIHGTHIEPPHIHGSNQVLSAALQHNDEGWRGNGGAAAATRPTNAANCKLNFSGTSSSNLHRDKDQILGNIVSTTRGESTVDSWIYPSD